MESGFPITSFLQIKQEIIADRNSLESEKVVWAAVRKPLSSTQIQSLDEQFKAVFETLGPVFPNTLAKLQPILQSLGDLVQRGASARLLQHYLHAMQTHLSKEMIPHLVNSFTSSNKGRKHFKAFFSLRPHWLLRTIISTSPETIFRLVARNEKELLAPFLKHFKPAMAALRDAKGHTLLHQAMQGKGRVSNTLRLLSDHLEK